MRKSYRSTIQHLKAKKQFEKEASKSQQFFLMKTSKRNSIRNPKVNNSYVQTIDINITEKNQKQDYKNSNKQKSEKKNKNKKQKQKLKQKIEKSMEIKNKQEINYEYKKLQECKPQDHPYYQEFDPRDKNIKILFKSLSYSKYLSQKSDKAFQSFLDEVRIWMIDVLETVSSVGFNYLKKQQLSVQEVKNFSAKNILLNIKELFEGYPELELEKKYELVQFVNKTAGKILNELMYKYPQTNSRGATRRIISHIKKIDNRESDEYDFLSQNGIKFHYKEDGDYSSEIMEAMNKIASCSIQTFNPNSSDLETNFEVFSEMMEMIFQSASYRPDEVIAKEVAELVYSKKLNKSSKTFQAQSQSNILSDVFKFGIDAKENTTAINKKPIKNYLIGHKIPSEIKLFSHQQIQCGNFQVYDSSILRIATKWAQQLSSKLKNAQSYIFQRYYKFKTSSKGQFISLQKQYKDELYTAMIHEQKIANQYARLLKRQMYFLQALFSEEQRQGKFAKKDVKVCVYAAKTSEISGQYTFKYINKLIHSLLQSVKNASEKLKNTKDQEIVQQLNFITFKVGDIMRCKNSCNQHQFLKILNALYFLNAKNPEILRISRIKNRLQKKDNDVLINLFFMNKVECQMQLSLTGSENKDEKKYTNYCHFIYEIIRSNSGTISQMSIIISQYDPLASKFSKNPNFGPQMMEIQSKQILAKGQNNRKYQQKDKLRKKLKIGQDLSLPFVCDGCLNLRKVFNPQFFPRVQKYMKTLCNQCMEKELKKLSKEQNKNLFLQHAFKLSTFQQYAKEFFRNHLNNWDIKKFISERTDLHNFSDSLDMDPRQNRSMIIRKMSKKPQLVFSIRCFVASKNTVIFALKDSKKEVDIIHKCSIKRTMQRNLLAIKQFEKLFYSYQIMDTSSTIWAGTCAYQKCLRKCCNKEVRIGYSINDQQIFDHSKKTYLKSLIQTQKNLLFLNNMSNGITILDKTISQINKNTQQIQPLTSVNIIQASNTKAQSLQFFSVFKNVKQLNLSLNAKLQRISGLEKCFKLQTLNLKSCNLISIGQLAKLKSLISLNLTNNLNLKSLEGLEDHSTLGQLRIGSTSICSLEPLKGCSGLKILDCENCGQLVSLKYLRSSKLVQLNVLNCSKLLEINLNWSHVKQLQKIETNIAKETYETIRENSDNAETFNLLLKPKEEEKIQEQIIQDNNKSQEKPSFSLGQLFGGLK